MSAQETFKVFPDQQSVIYWIGDNAPSRYTSCAVRDTLNWRCRLGEPSAAPLEYMMVDGSYAELTEAPLIPSTSLFYQMPRWRWWWVRLMEMIGSKR